MNDKNVQIQKLFGVLERHSSLVAEAFEGSVSFGDRQHNRALDALASINALKPHEEGIYRLNPRLRDFVADHFVSYQAYQTLTRISATVSQARSQWNEIRNLRASGDMEDVERLERAFDDSVGDIAYAIERNLTLINTLVSTQYGNVAGLESKLRQNTFYAAEVVTLLKEMRQVEDAFSRIAGEAMVEGMSAIRTLVARRLINRLLNWTLQVKAAQEIITQRLFLARQLEERLRRISSMSLWLRQNKTASGFEIDIKETAPVAIFAAHAVSVRRQVDVTDTDGLMNEMLIKAVTSMPPRKHGQALTGDPEASPPRMIEDGKTNAVATLAAHELQLDLLVDALYAATQPVSLADWKATQAALDDLSVEEWLLYGSVQLESQGFLVEFVGEPPAPGFPINRRFHDVLAKVA
jgi:biopolymer transport protein ExbB/TolQ